MDLEIIYPQIYVFHNALTNTDEFIDDITGSEEFVDPWHDWYDLGKQSAFKNYPNHTFDKFPNKEEWKQSFGSSENSLVVKISNIFYETTKKFVEDNNVSIPSWNHGSPNICTHYPKEYENEVLGEKNTNLAMLYHTDFTMARAKNRGYKHWITCNIYINEDYEGGNVLFKIFKNEDEFDYIDYKPKAGDMMIFPSTEPYYHGVKKTLFKEKYFIRMFWGYWSEGSPEWLANEQKYGKDIWKKMEDKRIEEELNSHKWFKT